MKFKNMIAGLLLMSILAMADTPPPNTVKAKMFTGDGVTSITATGTSLNMNLTNSSVPVTGTFFQATQPVSMLTLPALTTGSATIGNVNINGTVPISGSVTATNAANGTTGAAVPTIATQVAGVDGSSNLRALKVSTAGVLSIDGSATTQPVSGTFWQSVQPVSGTFWQTTQPISASSLPLPTGAAIASKQPALGTAGTASTDVITVQGIASMTPLKVDASGTTIPVSGTVTANIGTSGSLALDTSVNSLQVAQGSTTSGQKGGLVLGAVTAGAPTYSTTQSSPLSLTTGGLLRVDASGTILQVSQNTASNLNATVVGPSGIALAKDSSLTTINTTLGTPFQSGGSIGNTSFAATQATAASLNATVVGTAGASVATAANQSTMITDLATINTTLGTPFQAGGSIGNTTFAATQGTAANLNATVVGTAGAALSTAANQATEIGSLASIVTNTTGASTAALQTTGNASLASIDAGIPAGLGLAAASASMPVALPNATTLTTTAFTSVTGTLNTDMLTGSASGWFDAAGYGAFYADIYTTTTVTGGVITFEQTNDTTNDAAGIVLNLQDATVLTQTNVTSLTLAATTIKHYQAPITSRYIRFRISTAFAGTGTVGATVNFKQTPYTPITMPVSQATAGSLNTTVGSGTITTVSTVSTVTAANLAIPGIVADVVSGAIITTTTSATITPTAGVGYVVQIPVTAATGTLPTMVVQVNESDDTGTNFRTVYTFPTIITTGSYVSPPLFFRGNRIQYVQTITGTTPSFTRAINRLQMSAVAAAPVNNNATFATAAISGVTTLTAPANAIGFILENLSSNTGNLFWTIGATAATSSAGMLLEPGRDTGEVHAGQNVSVCPSTGTVTYSIQWIQQ